MITALAAALMAQTMTLQVSDDIWVYPHASDPSGDTYMRVWGVDGKSVPPTADDAEDFSMGYLKFSLAGTPTGQKLVDAKLVVTNAPSPGYTAEQSKYAPLEARSLATAFAEKGWDYANLKNTMPKGGIDTLYGSGYATDVKADTVTITIDLLKGTGKFAQALDAAQKSQDKAIAFALVSPINPAELGRSAIYKIFTKEEKNEKVRPKLILTWE